MNDTTNRREDFRQSADSELAGVNDRRLVLPLPDALYPCAHCYEEYSWPAEDLSWCPEIQKWICINCWDCDVHGDTRGTTLADEISRQNAEVEARQK